MLVRRPPPRALTASLLRRAQRGYTAADVEVARKAIAARRPQPEATDSTRVLYSPRVRRTFADIVTGRWRGHPIDLNHSHEDWARRESSDRHIRHVLTTFRSATFRRLLYPDLAVTTSISASVVLHNLLVAWEHDHTMTVESILNDYRRRWQLRSLDERRSSLTVRGRLVCAGLRRNARSCV